MGKVRRSVGEEERDVGGRREAPNMRKINSPRREIWTT